MHTLLYINTTCLVGIMLFECVLSWLVMWDWKSIGGFFPGEDYPSLSQNTVISCSSLSRVEAP